MYVNGVGAENSLFCAYFFCIYLKGFLFFNVRTLNRRGYMLFYMNYFTLFSSWGIEGECSFVERG